MTIDRTIDRLKLARHPHPHVLAGHANDVAKTLRRDAQRALDLAPLLAARGWPAGTIGSGARSADETTSVERAVETPGPFTSLDVDLARALRLYWQAGLRVQELIARTIEHADDVDPLPAGSGACEACGTVIRADGARPEHRIKAGLCPTDHRAWRRAAADDSTLDRGEWLRRRKIALAEGEREAS